ncbi:MAG: pilus assembly protein TadG-related protein [Bacillota bacterium]
MWIKEIISNSKKVIMNDNGQMLPFLAVAVTIMLLFGALSLGLSLVYKERTNVRDSLDAAVAASLSVTQMETKATSYYEMESEWDRDILKRDKLGNPVDWGPWYPIAWEPYEQNVKQRVTIDQTMAEAAARAYFDQNMLLDGIDYKVLDWQLSLNLENHPLQMVKNRPDYPNTNPYPGVAVKTWEENFPRWVEATITARVEVPVPVGKILGKETMVANMTTSAVKELK